MFTYLTNRMGDQKLKLRSRCQAKDKPTQMRTPHHAGGKAQDGDQAAGV